MTKISLYRWMRYLAFTFAAALVLVGALLLWPIEPVPPQAPQRPDGVPASAVWGGGVDGGVWHECMLKGEGYQCSLYHDHSGELLAKGFFLPRRVEWDAEAESPKFLPPEAPLPEPLPYEGYDGISISLGEHLMLVPHGVIDHPFGDGHGKKQQYEYGEPRGKERSY